MKIAALFALDSVPPTEHALDENWMRAHAVGVAFAPTIADLPHGLWFLDGLVERALLVETDRGSAEAVAALTPAPVPALAGVAR